MHNVFVKPTLLRRLGNTHRMHSLEQLFCIFARRFVAGQMRSWWLAKTIAGVNRTLRLWYFSRWLATSHWIAPIWWTTSFLSPRLTTRKVGEFRPIATDARISGSIRWSSGCSAASSGLWWVWRRSAWGRARACSSERRTVCVASRSPCRPLSCQSKILMMKKIMWSKWQAIMWLNKKTSSTATSFRSCRTMCTWKLIGLNLTMLTIKWHFLEVSCNYYLMFLQSIYRQPAPGVERRLFRRQPRAAHWAGDAPEVRLRELLPRWVSACLECVLFRKWRWRLPVLTSLFCTRPCSCPLFTLLRKPTSVLESCLCVPRRLT